MAGRGKLRSGQSAIGHSVLTAVRPKRKFAQAPHDARKGPSNHRLGESGSTRTESSFEEIYDTRLQVVHRTGHRYSAIRLHFVEHGTVLADVGHRDFHILAGDGINKSVILRRPFSGVRGRLNRGFNFRQQACEIAEFGVINSTLDRAA
jgi:hypothetical protein